MRPVVKRILVQGGLTAGILAAVGLALAEMASIWAAGNAGKPGSADLNPPPPESLRYRIPLTLAVGGFVFVAVGEWIASRVRARKEAAKAAEPRPDEAEKLLNELLAQAEAKMAAEAEPQRADGRGQTTEGGEQRAE
jgi:hypothetical protein